MVDIAKKPTSLQVKTSRAHKLVAHWIKHHCDARVQSMIPWPARNQLAAMIWAEIHRAEKRERQKARLREWTPDKPPPA